MIKPPLGISLLVHGGVILISRIIKLLPVKFTIFKWGNKGPAVGIITVFVIFVSVTYATGSIIAQASMSPSSQLYAARGFLDDCKPKPRDLTKKWKVVLRLDDVQAHGYRDTTFRMLQDAQERDIPLNLGVIPKDIEQDNRLYYLLQQHGCNFEIALHGWDNKVGDNYDLPEFGTLDYETAKEKIVKGKVILEQMTGSPLTTFIPPDNAYSTGTALALREAGFLAVSAEGDDYFDYTATTYDFEHHTFVPVNRVIEDCTNALVERSLCVVMIHPQDFMIDGRTDEKKYQHYLQLLDRLKHLDVSFVTFRDLMHMGSGLEQQNLT